MGDKISPSKPSEPAPLAAAKPNLDGEYIARIYIQAQARPLYNVAERLNFDGHQASDELHRASLSPGIPAKDRLS